MPITIEACDDPRVSDYFGLTDVRLRTRLEPEHGLYIAESEKVIRRALGAGHRPRSYLMARRWLTDLHDLVVQAEADGVPVYVGEHDVIEAMTGFHLHRGALVFGTEGDGLSPAADARLDARVTIPMMHGVDSLNVAASSAVAFYATRAV